MRDDLHVHLHLPADPAVLQKLDAVLAILTHTHREVTMAAVDITAARAEIRRNTRVDESIRQVVRMLLAKIEELKDGQDAETQAEIDALVTELRSSTDGVEADVVANTPAAPSA